MRKMKQSQLKLNFQEVKECLSNLYQEQLEAIIL